MLLICSKEMMQLVSNMQKMERVGREDGKMHLGELFKDEPESWPLRGDQFLWREFAETFTATPFPASTTELERMLETAFWEATGCTLSFCSEILVGRLAKQDETRGGVSGAMWRYRFFPLVIKRYEEAKSASAA